MPNYWIFQANPERNFRLRDWLAEIHKHGCVHVHQTRQHADDIHIDDVVYLWEATGTGLVGQAVVISEPAFIDTPSAQDRFGTGRNAEEFRRDAYRRVRLKVDRVFSPPALTRDEMKMDGILRNARIVTIPQRTNFRLSPAEAQRIQDFLRNAKSRPCGG